MSCGCWQCWPESCQYSIQTKVVLSTPDLHYSHEAPVWHVTLVTRSRGTWSGSPSPPCPSSHSPPCSSSPQPPSWQVTPWRMGGLRNHFWRWKDMNQKRQRQLWIHYFLCLHLLIKLWISVAVVSLNFALQPFLPSFKSPLMVAALVYTRYY